MRTRRTAPVQQAPVNHAPVQQAPVQQAPVQQAPVQQAPVQTEAVEQFDPSMFQLKLPDVFQSTLHEMPVQEVVTYPAFVGFVTERNASNFPEMKAGAMYLCLNGANIVLDPMKCWIVDAAGFFTILSDVDMTVQSAKIRLSENDDPRYQDHFPAIAIVDLGGELIPAKLDFSRDTRAQVIKVAINLVKEAATPEFAKKSDAHALAARIPIPWARVCFNVRSRAHMGKTGRISYPLSAVGKPTTLTDLKRLDAAIRDGGFVEAMERVRDAVEDRVAEIESKLVK